MRVLRGILLTDSILLLLTFVTSVHGGTITEPVTYQGQLKRGGTSVTDSCDFVFGLWDAQSDGNQIGGSIEQLGVSVENGLFQVELNLPPASFDGGDRWLEIAVRCPGTGTSGGAFTTLSPRERITFAPYALQTRGIFVDADGDVGIGTTQPQYDFHVRTAGTPIGGASVATVGIHNRFLIGLDFVNRWLDVSVGGDIDLTLHNSADLSFKRRSSQDSQPGSTALFLGADGKIGFGTDAPEEALHLLVPSSSADAYLKLSTHDDTGIFDAGVLLCDGSTTEHCAGMRRSGSSLSIRNDYNTIKLGGPGHDVVTIGSDSVRIGADRDPADLDVRGNLNVTGNVGLHYTNVDSGWIAGSTQVIVNCPAGTKVLGGGCETAGNADVVKRTYPGSDAGWICVFEIAESNHRAHAICASVQ